MEKIDLNKITRKLIVQIEDVDGNPALDITFFWLPASITLRTLPQFVALNDEPLAELQRDALEAVLQRQATVQSLSQEEPSDNPNVVTREALEAEIEARRSNSTELQSIPALLAARKLLLLLDPAKPTDLTDNGQPLKAEPEAFAAVIPVELMVAATDSIMEAMHTPFWQIIGAPGADTSSTKKPPEQKM